MRRIIPVILMSLSAGIFSCKSSPVAPEKPEYLLREFNESTLLVPNRPGESPRMDFDLRLLEVIGPQEDVDFFNGFLYSGNSPAGYAETLLKDARAAYLENREDAEAQPSEAPFNWEYLERMNFTRYKERGMVLERETYEYSGGAHGMGTTKYYVVDTVAHKVLELEDFFREDQGPRLRDIVIKELRRYSGERGNMPIADEEPLSKGIFQTDEPELSRNFFVNYEGLGLNWDPYEIAPYAAGSIEIILPWKAIRPLLRHDAMELLETFGIYQFM